MQKFKTQILVLFLATISGIPINYVWHLAGGELVSFYTLAHYMKISFFIGITYIVLLSFVFLKLRKYRYIFLIGLLWNIIVISILYVQQNIDTPQADYINRWIAIGIAAESVSTIITLYWYFLMKKYNQCLNTKKKELEQILKK